MMSFGGANTQLNNGFLSMYHICNELRCEEVLKICRRDQGHII